MRMNALAWPLALGPLLMLGACNGVGAPAQAASAAAASPAASAAAASPAATVLDSGKPPANQCNAPAVQFLVGQPYGASTLAQALAAAGADTVRLLHPDSMITKEYRMGRLNVVVDAANRVVRVDCG